jgi:CRISPR system Cascade subunit CasA
MPNQKTEDVFSDSLSFNADLLTELGDGWIYRIIAELENTEKWVWQLGILAADIVKAGAGDGKDTPEKAKAQAKKAREQAYFRMDVPFRVWLENLNPESGILETQMNDWRESAQKIVRDLGYELVSEVGVPAFIGRDVKGNHMSVPKAYNIFWAKTKIKTIGDG